MALRARIVLLSAEGHSNTEIARRLQLSPPVAGKWRQRFLNQRLDGLLDEPHPDAPRKLSDAEVERVLARPLETQPRGRPTGSRARSPTSQVSARAALVGSGAPFLSSRIAARASS
ncbi:MAG TPA: helix-turn-helix domain-containing protein [Candidatus Angelobacter sp.]